MQWILGIDFSAQPCELTLSKVEGNLVEIADHRTVDLPLLADHTLLAKTDLSHFISQPEKPNRDDLERESGLAEDVESQQLSDDNPTRTLVNATVAKLLDTVSSIENQWTAVSVIIPPHDHLALNLNLPFGDAKNLNRIVDLEVQDVVPFELDDFLVQYAPLGPI